MATRFGRRVRPYNNVLYAIPGNIVFVVPMGVTQLTVTLRGGGGGAGGGCLNGYDGYNPGGGGSGYLTQNVIISVTPGQKINGHVGKGGIGGTFSTGTAGGNGGAGETTTFGNVTAAGGLGGAGGVGYQYVQQPGGVGQFNGSVGVSVFSEYYLGGNGAGTTEDGYIVMVNGPGCQASRGGNSSITHTGYRIQQFPQGHVGSSNAYTYNSTFTAYYGRGGAGAGDFGNGSYKTGGLGGGGGGGGYDIPGGNGGDGYILIKWQ